MCPDRQILSVYFDEELPSPWKEKMEAHVAGCHECRARLEGYRRVSAALECGPAGEDAARERVWRKVMARRDRPAFGYTGSRIWRRSVTLPLPVAAAAAVILAAALGFAWFGRPASAIAPQEPIAGGGIDMEGIMPVSDMNGVFQYLSRDETGDVMILRLPESKNFTSMGEPAIVRAADYSRRGQTP